MCQIKDFCCQNPSCPNAGSRRKGNLRWHGWSGHKRQIRSLRCMTCMKCFSERKGTVLEHSRLPLEKTIAVMEHLREGCGIRGTSRLVRIHQKTVMRYARLAGKQHERPCRGL